MCSFEKDKMKYICCAKANLVKNGKNVVGYVMEENEANLTVSVKGLNEDVVVERDVWNVQEGMYYDCTPSVQSFDIFQLSQLWPFMIKLNVTGRCYILFSTTSINS